MSVASWGWPQYVVSAVFCINIIGTFILDGQEINPPRHYDFKMILLYTLIEIAILKAGGFY